MKQVENNLWIEVQTNIEEIAQSDMSEKQALMLIKGIDKAQADWDFTRQVAEFFAKLMSVYDKEFTDDTEISFLDYVKGLYNE